MALGIESITLPLGSLLVDLTSNVFLLCTNVKLYLYIFPCTWFGLRVNKIRIELDFSQLYTIVNTVKPV